MSKLNQKHLKVLRAMPQEQLLEIICELVADNKQAKTLLITNYLATAEDILTSVEKDYQRRTAAKRYYDYYEADSFFDELYKSVAIPLEKAVSSLPLRVETFSTKLLLDFTRLCDFVDTSSGGWMDYYSAVVDVWLTSLVTQKEHDSATIADKIMVVLNEEHYFSYEVFDGRKKDLGFDVIRALRSRLYEAGDINAAAELSLFIRDTQFIETLLNKRESLYLDHIIKYAEFLIDDLCADKAITVLDNVKSDKALMHSAHKDKWTEVYCRALVEEGKTEEAKRYCLEGFSHQYSVKFYNLFQKLARSENTLDIFIDLASKKGFYSRVIFLSEIQEYKRIDEEIINVGKKELLSLSGAFHGSFIRSLSSELFKHGYAHSATLLRRILVEISINRTQSKYYSYAASDMKKAIDYSEKIAWTQDVPSTAEYFKALYNEHKRKYALWNVMQETIAGLSVERDSISYVHPQKKS